MPWNRRTTRRDRKRRKAPERQMQRTFNRLLHEHTCRMIDMRWAESQRNWMRPLPGEGTACDWFGPHSNGTILSLRVEPPPSHGFITFSGYPDHP